MPMPQQSVGSSGKPSCLSRVKMGFMMGFTVGMCSAAIFGGFGALRGGYRGRELVKVVGQSMIKAGGTFGCFMSIGMGMRC